MKVKLQHASAFCFEDLHAHPQCSCMQLSKNTSAFCFEDLHAHSQGCFKQPSENNAKHGFWGGVAYIYVCVLTVICSFNCFSFWLLLVFGSWETPWCFPQSFEPTRSGNRSSEPRSRGRLRRCRREGETSGATPTRNGQGKNNGCFNGEITSP